MDKRELRNRRLFIIIYLLVGITGGLCAEGYLQAYMLEAGLSARMIGMYGTVSQAAALAAYALYPCLPRRKGEHRFLIVTMTLFSLYPVCYLLSLLWETPAVILGICMLGALLLSGAGAFRSTAEFALLPSLFPRIQYANVIGWGGMLGSGVALVTGLLGAFLSGGRATYRVLWSIASVCTLAAAFCTPRYVPADSGLAPAQDAGFMPMIRKLFTKRCLLFFLPHFIRGIAMGGMYYLITITLPHVDVSSSMLVPVTVGGTMAGNWLFLRMSTRVSSRKLILWVNGICALFMAILPAVRNAYVYLGVYLVYYITNIMSQNTVPMGVLRSTSQEELPFVSAMRMFCTSGASALTILLIAPLADRMHPAVIPLCSALVFIGVAVMFFRQFSDRYQ